MNYYISEKNFVSQSFRTAGIKARDDADTIFKACGFEEILLKGPDGRDSMGSVSKLAAHIDTALCWKKALARLSAGDRVFIQFPAINHSLFLASVIRNLNSRGVETVALIHDLEILRLSLVQDVRPAAKWRLKKEELDTLRLFCSLIVHNDSMRDYLNDNFNIPRARMTVLGIFDYLTDAPYPGCTDKDAVIIAGNLSKEKCAYIYHLPRSVRFELYGVGYSGAPLKNITYHGSFPPDTLPSALDGGYGLVWDGDSSDSCRGVWGEYLKYNNPHKTSLYLASGIPVIIWDKAALADLIVKNNCGITVSSLGDIKNALERVTDYDVKRKNARHLSYALRRGDFLKAALRKQ